MRSFIASLLLAPSLAAAAPKAPPLIDVTSLDTFKASFNADAGTVRLVMLLSPT